MKPCSCGSGKLYAQCCEPLHQGSKAPDALSLMRSRYSAYVLGLDTYLLNTWHPDTRPASLNLNEDKGIKWLGLSIKNHSILDQHRASVEFVARFKVGGSRAERHHETSLFEYLDGWYYISGELH
jgi:SEC-C motif domain protein